MITIDYDYDYLLEILSYDDDDDNNFENNITKQHNDVYFKQVSMIMITIL